MEYYDAGRPRRRRSRRSASTSSATAARPASGTPGRCPRRSRRSSTSDDLAVASVLSGNRNFEGRINPDVKMNFLASPPLVRRLRAGRDDGLGPLQRADRPGLRRRGRLPQGHLAVAEGGRAGRRGRRALGDVHVLLRRGLRRRRQLARPRRPDRRPLRLGRGLDLRAAADASSSTCPRSRRSVDDIEGARVLAKLGDSVTTDHISPAGRDQEGLAGRAVPRARRASSRRTSTPTARAAATTR